MSHQPAMLSAAMLTRPCLTLAFRVRDQGQSLQSLPSLRARVRRSFPRQCSHHGPQLPGRESREDGLRSAGRSADALLIHLQTQAKGGLNYITGKCIIQFPGGGKISRTRGIANVLKLKELSPTPGMPRNNLGRPELICGDTPVTKPVDGGNDNDPCIAKSRATDR